MALLLTIVLLCALPAGARVKTGIEVLEAQHFAPLKGKRVGLVTNHTGLTSDYRRTIDLLAHSPGVRLTAIFTPEHGITGQRDDAHIESGHDEATGVPIYSLYNLSQLRPSQAEQGPLIGRKKEEQGERFRPTAEMMREVNAIVYDIQDIGARFYTYITTLGYMVEEAGRRNVPIYVLDCPNPINGVAVEGPLLDDKYFSFVGYMRMPIRHGMTAGELARLYNGEKQLGADLHVIQMEGWRRSQWLDETGLPWVNPSPNMRSLVQAILYPGVCLLESKQVSVGRGTDTPFQVVGAPWFKSAEMADHLNARAIPGVRFIARRFTPAASLFKDQQCEGLEVLLLDRKALDSVALGIELVAAVLKFHPGKFDLEGIMRLLGNDATAARLKAGEDPRAIVKSWDEDLAAFRKIRAKYLLYK
jgi:uncharacterized protein YbbC (DUF1343 family)